MQEIFATIELVAPTRATVLLAGESGIGKDLIARAIHHHSPRRDRAFVKINCSALPENLMESELFGYEKGAFTGASAARTGKFQQADGGTVFLDEIGDVREVENIVQRAMVMAAGDQLDAADMQVDSQRARNLQESLAFLPHGLTLEEYEQELIREALRRSGGNKSQAARLLGLTRNAL